MTRLAIKSAESGTIYSINLDSVNFYEVRDFDSESSQCAIDFGLTIAKQSFYAIKANQSLLFTRKSKCAWRMAKF